MSVSTDTFSLEQISQELLRIRRELHKRAEISGNEIRTREYICGALKALGYRVKDYGGGVAADYNARRAVRTVAFRADMDALPLCEETGVDFASETPGVMHACGHDGHMAILLGLAHLVRDQKPNVNVRFVFQPKEERGGGAEEMIAAGVLDGIDLVFGLHLTPELPAGTAATIAGGLFAGACEFSVEFTGRSAHVANAEQARDALAAAVRFYERAHALWRDKYARHTRFGLCRLNGGTAHNIVPDSARIEGTFRFYDHAKKEAFFMDAERILCDLEKEIGVAHRFESFAAYPPLINTPALTEYLMKELGIAETHARWTAEDFSQYLERVPGMYFWLGIGDAYAETLHCPTFNFDERILLDGLRLDLKIIEQAERGEI